MRRLHKKHHHNPRQLKRKLSRKGLIPYLGYTKNRLTRVEGGSFTHDTFRKFYDLLTAPVTLGLNTEDNDWQPPFRTHIQLSTCCNHPVGYSYFTDGGGTAVCCGCNQPCEEITIKREDLILYPPK